MHLLTFIFSYHFSGGDFKLSQAFVGEVSHVNVWAVSYTTKVIASMFRSRGHWNGNAVPWYKFKDNVKGTAQVVTPSSWIREGVF